MAFWIHLVNKLIMALSCHQSGEKYENPTVKGAWNEATNFQQETDRT